MAVPLEGVLVRSRVSLLSKVAGACLKRTNRSCHVSVQEPLERHASSQLSSSATMMQRSLKPLRNRLLSDRMSSAMTLHPLSVVRLYSALPHRAIFTTPVWEHEDLPTDSADHRKCWNCGRGTDALRELFFCKCGVIQTPAKSVTYFTLFGTDEGFEVDLKRLGEVYKGLQKRLHPDMFSQKSETEQTLAEEQSGLLNKAYFTLLKPLPRALYLLELHGYIIEEGTTDMNPEFLMEVLDLNERIGESTSDDIHEIEGDIASKIEENVKLLSSAFAVRDYETAHESAVRLKYYVNVESKVKTFYRDRM